MRIACLLSSVSRKAGGLHESVRRLSQSMQSEVATDVHVLGLRDEFTDEDSPGWAPLPTRAFPVRGPWQFGYAPQLKRAMFELNPDVVHIHGLWMYPAIAAGSWHRRTRRPLVVHPHGMLDDWAVNNSRWKKRIAGLLYENPNLRRASCIRALSQAEVQAIRSYGLRNPICVVPNGIDLPQRKATLQPPWAEKIEPGRKVLLYLGRLHPKKGLPNLLRAWSEVRRQKCVGGQQWDLVVAGWSQNGHEEELKQLAAKIGIASNVSFVGAQFGDAKVSAYYHADAFVLPSLSEGLPMVVLEAWTHRVPVMMTPECNVPEGFEAGAAIRIETGVGPIAAGLEQLFRMHDEERKTMGARGYRLVERCFNWRSIAGKMHSVNEWVLGRGPRPGCVLTE